MITRKQKDALTAAIADGRLGIKSLDGFYSPELYSNGFEWKARPEWTVAPDWCPEEKVGGGLHMQGPEAGGFRGDGKDIWLCETRGARINLDNKIKVEAARLICRIEEAVDIACRSLKPQL